jgi:hypothetical protein
VALVYIILICSLFNDAAMANFRYHLPGGTEENHEKPVRKDSKQVPPEYKLEALPLAPPCSVDCLPRVTMF